MALNGNVNEKLRQVLNKFLRPDFNIATTTYLDLLLTQINEQVEKGNQQILQTTQDWIVAAVNTWHSNSRPCQSVSTFILKLVGSLSTREANFLILANSDVSNKLYSIFGFENTDVSASMKMAFTSFCISLLEHAPGRRWIDSSGAWKVILKYAQLNHTMYVTKESQKFLSKLLIKECHNESLCKDIILGVTTPLINATIDTKDGNQPYALDKQILLDQSDLLLNTMELLLAVLEYTTFHNLENPIPGMFEELTSLESRVKVMFEVSISTPYVKTVHKLSKLLVFCKLRQSLQTSDTVGLKDFEQFCLGLCYNSTMLLSKKYILDLVVSKKLGVVYWKKLQKLKSFEAPHPFKFEIQAVALMILPLCVTMKPKYMKQHYLIEEFMEKLFEITCTPVQRLCYSIRDVILKNEFPMEYICKSTCDHLLEIVDLIERTVSHALANFVTNETPGDEAQESSEPINYVKRRQESRHFLDGDPINDKQVLLAALLNCLNVLTEKFKFKWQECVETICMLSLAQEILNHPGVELKICILALKTCKLAIENFMPPNLALLVDFDDQTREIGPTLFKRLHDTHWEVKDSVLEILDVIARYSEHKYPMFQGLILENGFLPVVVAIAKDDAETYVRASALAFLAKAVCIKAFWEKLLQNMELQELAIKLVHSESEAVVRREAVILLTELYVHRPWSKQVVSQMAQAMVVAAVVDLHWEVKANALQFWRQFIKSHLTDQGMLDGQFPSVTFSKENRKIVSLTESEVKQRLNKALDELSRQGCLGVLLAALKDESDLEVCKVSADVIDQFRRTLVQYKVNEPEPEPPLPKDSAIIDTKYIKRPPPPPTPSKLDSASVIEDIVGARDESLLADIYSESMCMGDKEDDDEARRKTFERLAKVTREKFLRSVLNFDLSGYVEERQAWLRGHTSSFDSVLEDILLVSDRKDVNSMDCY